MKINDLIRGEVSWPTDSLGDFVILRGTGLPVYNFCVVVDDAMMGITHVIRWGTGGGGGGGADWWGRRGGEGGASEL